VLLSLPVWYGWIYYAFIRVRKIVIKIFCWISCIVLSLILFWVSCNGCKKHYDVSSATKKSPKEKSKKSRKGRSASSKENNKDNKSKLRLTANAKGSQFLVCGIHPPEANTNLKQYKVAASAIEGKGEGQLLAATKKENRRFQYELLLRPECQPVSPIYFIERDFEERLKNGNLIRFKCLYKPAVGSKKGEKHHLNLAIFYYDQQDRLVEKNEITACITIKDDILG
jgi:hypothetical protein